MNENSGPDGALSNPNVRLGLGVVAAIAVGVPLLYAWGWTFDRMQTNSAIGSATEQGEKALAKGDSIGALIAFNHARELRPSSPKLERAVWRARARFLAENADRVTLENLEESTYQLESLLAEEPQNATFLVAAAHVAEKRGENVEADKLLAAAVKADPKSVVAHLARAAFLQKTSNKVNDVIGEYNAILASDPNNYQAHFGLGRMYLVNKDTAKEMDEYNKAIKIDPNKYEVHEALGDAYLHLGGNENLTNAYREYTRAASIQPNNPEPHWGLGIIQSQAGNWKQAESEMRMAMRGKRYPEMEFQLGLALARQNRCNDAMPLFAQFLRDEPNHGAALYELGACAQTLGQKDNAFSYFKKVLDLPLPAQNDPKRAEAEKRNVLVKTRLAMMSGPAARPAGPR